jgi:Spy/CpxP family protein refolding chaperone
MHGGEHGKGPSGGHQNRGGHGKHGEDHGKGHGGTHLFGPNWRKTLTPEQKTELDRLHVAFAKTKAPLTAGIQALKVRLAVLVTSEQPDPEAVNGLIEEILQAKREVMSAKYQYIVAQRGVLTPSQQLSFDMEAIHQAMEGKQERHGRGGKGH